MKVLLDFDLDNPEDMELFNAIKDLSQSMRSSKAPPPPEYTQAKQSQAAAAAPPPPPPAAPLPPVVADVTTYASPAPEHVVVPQETPPPPPVQQNLPAVPQIGTPLKGQAAIPTPTTNLRDQLHQSFISAFAKDPATADKISQECRTKYGADDSTWTDEQAKEVITRLQTSITF